MNASRYTRRSTHLVQQILNTSRLNFNLKEMSQTVATYVSIKSTYNNTSVTIHKSDGLILFSVTAGALGFKKSKRSTSYAAQSCGEKVALYLSSLKSPSMPGQRTYKSTEQSSREISAVRTGKPERKKAQANVRSTEVPSKLAQLYVCVNGVGTGKYSVIRGLIKGGVKIKKIIDITAVPHNGCRPPKQRRL